MAHASHTIDSAILHYLKLHGSCSMDELVQRLPVYTWNQVFAAIDRLSRVGKLVLHSRGRFEYVVSPMAPSIFRQDLKASSPMQSATS